MRARPANGTHGSQPKKSHDAWPSTWPRQPHQPHKEWCSYLGVQLGKLLVIQQALGVHSPLVPELKKGSKKKNRHAGNNPTLAPHQRQQQHPFVTRGVLTQPFPPAQGEECCFEADNQQDEAPSWEKICKEIRVCPQTG